MLEVHREQIAEIDLLRDANIGASATHQGDTAQLKATIQNIGDLDTNYLVTVTGFTGCVDPVPAQWSYLAPGASREITFDRHRCDAPSFTGEAIVTALALNAHEYGHAHVTFD